MLCILTRNLWRFTVYVDDKSMNMALVNIRFSKLFLMSWVMFSVWWVCDFPQWNPACSGIRCCLTKGNRQFNTCIVYKDDIIEMWIWTSSSLMKKSCNISLVTKSYRFYTWLKMYWTPEVNRLCLLAQCFICLRRMSARLVALPFLREFIPKVCSAFFSLHPEVIHVYVFLDRH